MTQPRNAWQINAIVVLLCLVFAVLAFQVVNSYKKPVKWEYEVRTIPDNVFEREMSILGYQGWEAISARRASDNNQQNPVFSYEIIFKRPVGVYESSSLVVK